MRVISYDVNRRCTSRLHPPAAVSEIDPQDNILQPRNLSELPMSSTLLASMAHWGILAMSLLLSDEQRVQSRATCRAS